MERIQHKMMNINGINMHIAEMGEGPIVLLIHGFPELWYTWRHQIVYLAAHGYHAIAPDLRGYGDTTGVPVEDASKFTSLHVVGDLVALIDALGADKVFVVGHDWGAMIAWSMCLFRPDKVKALVNLSIHFTPRNPRGSSVAAFRAAYGDDHKFLTHRDISPFFFPKDKPFGDAHDTPVTLPPWLTEEEVDYYTTKFEQTGFTGALNYYRCFDRNWELEAPWTGAKISVPVKFVVGDLDLIYNMPGAKDYIHKGIFKKFVPLLEDVVVIEGAGHFITEEIPDEINKHIHDFLVKF